MRFTILKLSYALLFNASNVSLTSHPHPRSCLQHCTIMLDVHLNNQSNHHPLFVLPHFSALAVWDFVFLHIALYPHVLYIKTPEPLTSPVAFASISVGCCTRQAMVFGGDLLICGLLYNPTLVCSNLLKPELAW